MNRGRSGRRLKRSDRGLRRIAVRRREKNEHGVARLHDFPATSRLFNEAPRIPVGGSKRANSR